MDLNDFTFSDIVSILVGLLSLFVSVIVLLITYKTWKLKSGNSVRAMYGITSSIAADGPYVSKVIVENLKDKELIIFAIYLKYGTNIYIDLLDIDNHYDRYHHILPPLSTRVFELGAPIYYHSSAREVDVEKLLRFDRYNGEIILLTNNGKIKAKHFKKGWSPISQYFKNYATIYVRPARLYTDSSCPLSHNQSEHVIDYSAIEKTTKYVVKIRLNSGDTHQFYISDSYNYVIFQKLKFTPAILASKDALKEYLFESRDKNLLSFDEIIEIIDVQDAIQKDKKTLLSEKIDIIDKTDVQNWFQYYVVWKIKTWIYKLKNPIFPSKLYSFYCLLGIKQNPNRRKKKS